MRALPYYELFIVLHVGGSHVRAAKKPVITGLKPVITGLQRAGERRQMADAGFDSSCIQPTSPSGK